MQFFIMSDNRLQEIKEFLLSDTTYAGLLNMKRELHLSTSEESAAICDLSTYDCVRAEIELQRLQERNASLEGMNEALQDMYEQQKAEFSEELLTYSYRTKVFKLVTGLHHLYHMPLIGWASSYVARAFIAAWRRMLSNFNYFSFQREADLAQHDADLALAASKHKADLAQHEADLALAASKHKAGFMLLEHVLHTWLQRKTVTLLVHWKDRCSSHMRVLQAARTAVGAWLLSTNNWLQIMAVAEWKQKTSSHASALIAKKKLKKTKKKQEEETLQLQKQMQQKHSEAMAHATKMQTKAILEAHSLAQEEIKKSKYQTGLLVLRQILMRWTTVALLRAINNIQKSGCSCVR